MSDTGSLTQCYLQDICHLLYLTNIYQSTYSNNRAKRKKENLFQLGDILNLDNICLQDREGRTMQRPRRRFSLREGNKQRSTDRRSKLISAPTNFNHISHMGPGEGIQRQKLIDLTANLEHSKCSQIYSTGAMYAAQQQQQHAEMRVKFIS